MPKFLTHFTVGEPLHGRSSVGMMRPAVPAAPPPFAPRVTSHDRVPPCNRPTSVSSQIALDDLARAAGEGFVLVINNRPDDETPGQPSSAEVEAAARAAGLDYVHVPVRGGPTHEQVEAVRRAVEGAEGPVLAFCRSGTRSIVTWSLGQAFRARRPRHPGAPGLRDAGYDLSGVLGV